MSVYEIEIEPMDPLLFGDNRSARAGIDHLQLDQDPSPITLHGAIGQLLVARFGDPWPDAILGPRQQDILQPQAGDKIARLLGICYRNAAGERIFPRPRHLRCEVGNAEQPEPFDLLAPRELEGGRVSWQQQWPRILQPRGGELPEEPEEEEEGEILLAEHALQAVLCNELPTGPRGLLRPEALYKTEARPGISVDNRSSTVFEGQFFTRPYRRFQPPGVDPRKGNGGFTAWFRTLAPLEEDLEAAIGFVGGDRRRACFRFLARDEETRPLSALRDGVVEAVEEQESAGFLLYLLTPLLQVEAPLSVDRQTPVAAALGRPSYVSGWDVSLRRPRPVRPLIPAGSVFFYDWPEGSTVADKNELIRSWWLRPLQELGAAAGFGRCLVGIWR